jgi:hypothetical protein
MILRYSGGKMGQEYARIGRNRIMQMRCRRPQPVMKLIGYKLEGIGSTGRPAFITQGRRLMKREIVLTETRQASARS